MRGKQKPPQIVLVINRRVTKTAAKWQDQKLCIKERLSIRLGGIFT